MPKFGEAPGFTAADRANLEAILVDTGTTLDALIKDIFALSDTPRFYSYPTLTDVVDLISTTTAYGYGLWTEIIPANTITAAYWLYGLTLNNAFAVQAVFEIATGAASSEVVIGLVEGFDSREVAGRGFRFPLPVKIPANTRISARVATSGITARTYGAKLQYFTI